jgi:hypothetical protein
MRILLPGVMMDEISLSQVKRVAEILDKTKGANVSLGRIEDVMAGMKTAAAKTGAGQGNPRLSTTYLQLS